jgi:hypothetical protein
LRRQLKKRVGNYPFCIYCGGTEAATTVDHMPSRGMFPARRRPPGLEVPSCHDCNFNSRRLDDLVALLVSIKLERRSETEWQHYQTKLRAAGRNMMEVLRELYPTPEQRASISHLRDSQGRPVSAMNLGGPLVPDMLLRFGAKCWLALHYKETGIALPAHKQIAVFLYSNYDAFEDKLPHALMNLLPERRSLGRGKVTAHHTFEYSSTRVEGGADATTHWATFGETFMYAIFASVDDFDPESLPGAGFSSPGVLKAPASPEP